MSHVEKTVFISYRRDDSYEALAVYQYLTNQQYDVFLDYTSIRSGDFEQIIVSNIRARAHFILILTPTALNRCDAPGDWLRREIEMAIDEKRNIIPLFFNGFSFSSPTVVKKLTGKLASLRRYNGLSIPTGFFNEAMARLSNQYLSVPLDAVILPVSTEVQKTVEEKQNAANQALEDNKEDIKHVVNSPSEIPEEKEVVEKVFLPPVVEGHANGKRPNSRMYGIAAVVLVLILTGIFGINSLIQTNKPKETPTPTLTQSPTPTFEPTKKIPVLPVSTELTPTETPVLPTDTATITPTATIGVGSTMTSDKDGMILLYVPQGKFDMGSVTGQNDEDPVHTVFLNTFWIDQTEITNAMYRKCVETGPCKSPVPKSSQTRTDYYMSIQFNDFPVVNVSWEQANSYCSWAGRRLPTEAEWEKAASWDEKNQKKLIYPWGDTIDCSLANYGAGNAGCKLDTTQVGTYQDGASAYGVLGMAGNVWEWIYDNYDPNFYNDPSVYNNPVRMISNGKSHVVRGGSWFDPAVDLRTTNRLQNEDNIRENTLGFRCALSP